VHLWQGTCVTTDGQDADEGYTGRPKERAAAVLNHIATKVLSLV